MNQARLSQITVSSLVSLLTLTAHAGWTSGGGQISGDSHNPWFLQNTSEVHACLEIDEANMGQSRAEAKAWTEKALSYWQRQLAEARNTQKVTEETVQLGTQTIVFDEACSDVTDLRFQFGVLTEEQKTKLPDTRRFVGLAVRTDYDRQTLRGKGFIYISPHSGPLAMQGRDVTPEIWSKYEGIPLYVALLHELGHVYGLKDNSPVFLMQDNFLEGLLKQSSHEGLTGAVLAESFINHEPDFAKFTHTFPLFQNFCFVVEGGTPTPQLKHEFFGIPIVEGSCAMIDLKDRALEVTLGLRGKDTEKQNISIGRAELTEVPELAEWLPVSEVVLTPEQRVFPTRPHMSMTRTAAEVQRLTYFKGTYRSEDGKISRPITVRVAPWGLPVVSGVVNGELISDIDKEK